VDVLRSTTVHVAQAMQPTVSIYHSFLISNKLLIKFIDVAYQKTYNSSATIYAKFDGSDSKDEYVKPGCELRAEFPSSYGDVYFGSDNCLYDSGSSKIFDQCCTAKATTTVRNPYYQAPVSTTTTSTTITAQPAPTINPNPAGTNLVRLLGHHCYLGSEALTFGPNYSISTVDVFL
jgi:hypothetical protein